LAATCLAAAKARWFDFPSTKLSKVYPSTSFISEFWLFLYLSIKVSFVRVLNTRFMFDFDCVLTIFLISLE
jgi:hypothetical protein